MNKQRVIVVVHKDLVPPDSIAKDVDLNSVPWLTEYDVINQVRKLGHDVEVIGMLDELRPLRLAIQQFKPHLAFNLLEEFDGEALYDQHVVSYFELMKTPYTGCNPRGLTLARDKALAKKILTYHKIRTPKFYVFPRNRKIKIPKKPKFPLIVKCLNEEASLGLSKASLVHNDQKLRERVNFIHEHYGVDAMAEHFVEGCEVYVGLVGNYNLSTFQPWLLHFAKSNAAEKQFYTSKAKFDPAYRKSRGIYTAKASLDDTLVKKLQNISKRAFRVLGLNGYARMDFRITENGEIYLLEANPNPDIAREDDFSASAIDYGYSYPELLTKIMSLGKSWASRYSDD